MKESKLQTILFSAAGVVLVFIALVGANLLFSPVRSRVDMTAEKLHTLSSGTKSILARIDAPVQVRLYISQGKESMPAQLKTYAQSVEDLLAEFKAQARGNLEIKKFDPQPDSEAEDSAKLDGIEPQLLNNGEQVYLGVTIEYAPQKASLPFLSPQREKLLEYDLARAISQVLATNKPVIGVMTPLQVFGQPMNPMMMQMGRQQGSEPWVFINELKQDFDVEQVGMDVDSIDEKIKVMIVMHPKEISDKAQFALDQFVLRGGKLIGLLDALCLADNQKPNPMGFNLGGGSSLPKLLKAWGLEFDTTKVVADLNYMKQLGGRDGRPQLVPSFLFMTPVGINKDDAVTSQSDDIWLPFAGAFTGKPADGLKQDVLLKTTDKSQLVDGVTAQLNGQKIVDDFKASGINYTLATRLTGKFKTAFPDGKPGETNAPAGGYLKESKGDGVVYLFGDTDFLYDPYCVQVNQMFHMASPVNGNLNLLQNLVEQAAGDANLIGARGRASIRRPFTVVQKMETEARMRYQSKIEGLDKKLQDLQSKLSEMQVKKEGNVSKVILSPEQQAALKQFSEQQSETKKELRKERRNLRLDVDALEFKLKVANIFAMPLLVAIAGIGLAVARRKKVAAK
ncbi:MAG TPA: GldG family protein [Candidatus Limnocylindria bacterium]|nr:GldG family protein [Candidatus Limnocylindria bacterium]